MIYIAIAPIIIKFLAQHVFHILDVMPYTDIFTKYQEHSHLILLIAIPAPEGPLKWLVYFLWVFGGICYIDDVYQEYIRKVAMDHHLETGDFPDGLYYTSPLHRFGEWIGVI